MGVPDRAPARAEPERRPPLDDMIAVGALLALAVWGLLVLSGGGQTPADLGWLDPGAWWQGRRATRADLPLLVMLAAGGVPLVLGLIRRLVAGQFGSDLLAGISIVTSVVLGEYLAGLLVVLMLSGGAALEARAVTRAGDVLHALARRMPAAAHRRRETGVEDIAVTELAVGDVVVVFPHEICPVDGTVVAGRGSMDESYLTGEPYLMAKAPGSTVLSGAVNGTAALDVRTDRVGSDSRYAKIVEVLSASQQRRPRLRRLADALGAGYTPLAVGVAVAAWAISGSPTRFLAVLVVATPCPLLIAIPVAVIGAVSLAAKRGIVIRDPVILERLQTCRTAIFDKTGTLTYGAPAVTEVVPIGGNDPDDVLAVAAALERYSKHPLAAAVVAAARERSLPVPDIEAIDETPGRGLTGRVRHPAGSAPRDVVITNRRDVASRATLLPPSTGGLECVVVVDGEIAAVLRFRDSPRRDGRPFVQHLAPAHGLTRVMLVSGDREAEVRWLADVVGISEVHAGVEPEGKLRLVEAAAAAAPTLFVGDGINDAPALAAATVGIALGAGSDVTTEAAGAVVMESSLERIDELLHIAGRFRRIALESAVGGMAASVVGMGFAACGLLPPVAGALLQEVIDVFAVGNALRMALPPQRLSDFRG